MTTEQPKREALIGTELQLLIDGSTLTPSVVCSLVERITSVALSTQAAELERVKGQISEARRDQCPHDPICECCQRIDALLKS